MHLKASNLFSMKNHSLPVALASILASTSVNAFSNFQNTNFVGVGVLSGKDVLYYKDITQEKGNANIYAELGTKVEFENRVFAGGRINLQTQQKMYANDVGVLDFMPIKYGADVFAGVANGDRLSSYIFLGRNAVKVKSSDVFGEDFLIRGVNFGIGMEYLTTNKTAIIMEYSRSKTKGSDFGFGKNGMKNPDGGMLHSDRLKVGFRYFI